MARDGNIQNRGNTLIIIMYRRILILFLCLVMAFVSCRKAEEPQPTPTPDPPTPEVIHVESVTLPDTTYVGLALDVQIPVQVLPENATDKSLTWYSMDEKIAVIDSAGVAHGLKTGTCNIVAVSNDGGIDAHGKLTVQISKVELKPEMVSTNMPMQYVTWGYSPDGTWTGSNMVITASQSASRLAKYGRPENMWDGDEDTEFHTNFDVCTVGSSWSHRSGTSTKYEYIQFDLGEPLARCTIRFTVSKTTWFDTHGYRLEFSEDGQTYLDADYADYHSIGLHTPVKGVAGERFVINDTIGQTDKPFRGFRIVPIHGYTSSDMAGYWGIAEIEVYRTKI